jgi:type I restriction enzyme R subunit
VEAFAQVFYKPTERQNVADHAHTCSGTAAGRGPFQRLRRKKSAKIPRQAQRYVKLYAFLSQIIPYADPELEMLQLWRLLPCTYP